jgi:hypothetical protein
LIRESKPEAIEADVWKQYREELEKRSAELLLSDLAHGVDPLEVLRSPLLSAISTSNMAGPRNLASQLAVNRALPHQSDEILRTLAGPESVDWVDPNERESLRLRAKRQLEQRQRLEVTERVLEIAWVAVKGESLNADDLSNLPDDWRSQIIALGREAESVSNIRDELRQERTRISALQTELVLALAKCLSNLHPNPTDHGVKTDESRVQGEDMKKRNDSSSSDTLA